LQVIKISGLTVIGNFVKKIDSLD